MKSIKILFVALLAFVFTSCTKEDVNDIIESSSVTVGFQVAGIPIELTFGGRGTYYGMDAYNSFVYRNGMSIPETTCYVIKKPGNSESFDVYDRNGNRIGNVRCWQGVGSQVGVLWANLQQWFVNHPTTPCTVNVQWEPNSFTHGAERKGTVNG